MPNNFQTLMNGVSSPAAKRAAALKLSTNGVSSKNVTGLASGYLRNTPNSVSNFGSPASQRTTDASLNTIAPQDTAASSAAAASAKIKNQALKARDTALGAGRNSFGDLTSGYSTGLEGLLQKIRTGQEGLNQSRENNSLNRIRSLTDLKDSVRQGIQSGSVRLANGNALDSSAAEAVAKGYGRFGTQQAGDIQNEFALGERDIDTNQRNLDYEREAGLRGLEDYKRQQASSIGNSVYDRLASIQESAMSQGEDAGIGDINAYKQQIINEALAQLRGLDQRLQSGLGGIKGLDRAQIEANAYNLANTGGGAGVANTFQYDTAPAQGAVQNGAPLAQLPIVRRPEDQLY